MSDQKIPLKGLGVSVEDTANVLGSFRLADGFIDSNGYFNKRPGMTRAAGPISEATSYDKWGCIYHPTTNLVYILKDNGTGGQGGGDYIFSLTQDDTFTQIAHTSTLVSPEINTESERRACFTRYGGVEYLVTARGGRMSAMNTVTNAMTFISTSAISGSPSTVVRPLSMDGYLIAQTKTGNRFYFSEVDDPFTWSPVDFVEATSVADDIVGMETHQGRIYVFGSSSIEVFFNDGVSPFRRVDNGTINIGCLQGSSIKAMKEGIYFLDSNRKISLINDQGITVISDDISHIIEGIQGTGLPYDNYFGFEDIRIHEFYNDSKKMIMVTLPNTQLAPPPYYDYIQKGLTLVYDTSNKMWYEWTSWIYTNGTYGRTGLRVNFSAYAIGQKRTIFLLRNFQQYIGYLSNTTFQEIVREDTPTTLPIHCEYKTGFNDYGTGNKKRCSKLRIRANKYGAALVNSSINITALNENNTTLSTRTIPLSGGFTGINTFYLNQLGDYRIRQYIFTHTDNAPFVFGDIVETIEPMMS